MTLGILTLVFALWVARRPACPPPPVRIDITPELARAAVEDYVEEHGLLWSESTIARVTEVAQRCPAEPFRSIAARLADERHSVSRNFHDLGSTSELDRSPVDHA